MKLDDDIKATILIVLMMVVIVLGFGMVYYTIFYGDMSCMFRECLIK